MTEETKAHRLCFNIDGDMWDEFHKHLPYRGEKTAFLNRCIKALVDNEDPSIVLDEILRMAELARRDVSQRR